MFQIGFDGEEMEEDPVPLHSSSELLFPVGYAGKYGIRLKGPKDTGAYTFYDSYLNARRVQKEPLCNKTNK